MPSSKEQQAVGAGSVEPARTKLIESARASWISRLIDLSRRNNLLYYSFRIPKTGLRESCPSHAKRRKIAKRKAHRRFTWL